MLKENDILKVEGYVSKYETLTDEIRIHIKVPIELRVEVAQVCELFAWVGICRIEAPEWAKAKLPKSSTGAAAVVKPPAAEPAQTGRPAPVEESRVSKRDWVDLPPQTQAAIVGSKPAFWKFAEEQHEFVIRNEAHAAEFIRQFCQVDSRKDLATNHRARMLWHGLADQYRIWLDHPEFADAR